MAEIAGVFAVIAPVSIQDFARERERFEANFGAFEPFMGALVWLERFRAVGSAPIPSAADDAALGLPSGFLLRGVRELCAAKMARPTKQGGRFVEISNAVTARMPRA